MRIRTKFLGVTGIALFSIACSHSNPKRIVVISRSDTGEYWQAVHAGAVAAAREDAEYELQFQTPNKDSDYMAQIQMMDKAVKDRVGAICLAAADPKLLVSLVESASAVGVPVITFEAPVDTETHTAQIVMDNYQGGRLAASRMGRELASKGRVIEIQAYPATAATAAWEKGFDEGINEEFPNMTIVDRESILPDALKSARMVQNMVATEPTLGGIFASSEAATVAAIQGAKSGRDVKIIGSEATPELVEALRGGTIDALLVPDPFQLGYGAVKAALQKIKTGTTERMQRIVPVLVTKENMDSPQMRARLKPDIAKYLTSAKP
jgi:ABC-type sugar transport system substrate-binding protein